jgi:hypothetical protein
MIGCNKNAFLPVNPKCEEVVLNWPCGCQTIYIKDETPPSNCSCTK